MTASNTNLGTVSVCTRRTTKSALQAHAVTNQSAKETLTNA